MEIRLGVETDDFPRESILEAEAIPKSRHDNNIWTTGYRILDLMGRAEHANQPSDVMMLSTKAMEKLMEHQTLMGMMKGSWKTHLG